MEVYILQQVNSFQAVTKTGEIDHIYYLIYISTSIYSHMVNNILF